MQNQDVNQEVNTVDTDIMPELSHSMVHYLLSIHKLKEIKGYARVTDIARELHLTKGSVSTALNNLKRKKLVIEEENSKFLILTDLGHDEVHRILSARTLLFYFLRDFLGVSEKIAALDSCQMEHLMSAETRERFFYFMKSVSGSNDVLEAFIQQIRSNLSHKKSHTLNLESFENLGDFLEGQRGDAVLSDLSN